jgi:hypothetical protein
MRIGMRLGYFCTSISTGSCRWLRLAWPSVPSRLHSRARAGGRRVTRIACEASALLVITGIAAGCGEATTGITPSMATMPASTASTSGNSAAIATTTPSARAKTRATGAKTQSPGAVIPAGTTRNAPLLAAAPPSSASTAPAAAQPSTTTTTQTQTSALTGATVTLSCPNHAATSASGCGSVSEGPSSGQAPGFAAGQQSSPNLLEVNQDPWSSGQGPQVLTASGFQDWSVTATDTDPADAPGEVLTFPDASFDYYQVNTAASSYTAPPSQYDLNDITSLTSDFTESMPQLSNLNAEAAYDMWLNNWQTEVMVWVDTSPAKDRNLADDGMTDVGTYTYGGQNFALWRKGSGITGFYIFLLDHNETSGTVDLKAMLETMISLQFIPATSPLTEIPFGWEISDTGGNPVTFSLSRFDVNLEN